MNKEGRGLTSRQLQILRNKIHMPKSLQLKIHNPICKSKLPKRTGILSTTSSSDCYSGLNQRDNGHNRVIRAM